MKVVPPNPTYTVSPSTCKAMVAVPITYYDTRLPRGFLCIEIGTKTDGASIPRPFRWFIGQPLTPKFWKASLIHDVLYSARIGKQKDADDIFLALLKEAGVGKVKRSLMWGALRAFGWVWWRT